MKTKYLLISFVIISALMLCGNYAPSNAAYDSQGKRDPFVALVSKEGRFVMPVSTQAEKKEDQKTNITDLNLQGIMYDTSGTSIVVINGELLKTGESLGPVTIKEITQNYVAVVMENKEYILNLYEGGDEL